MTKKIEDLGTQLKKIDNEPIEKGITNTKQRKKDLAALRLAKEVEKLKKGFVWIGKEKTNKLVYKDKLEGYINDVWKVVNVKDYGDDDNR